MERHLGLSAAVTLILNRSIGTGIFSIPSSVYGLTGSIGLSLLFWVLGGVVAACGFSVYFEYGLELPENGGEKTYLERVYRQPKNLAVTIFALSSVILSFSTSNSIAFGNYVQLAFTDDPSADLSRYIAVVVVFLVCILHARWPEIGKKAFQILGTIKVLILVFICGCVPFLWAGLLGDEQVQETMRTNFEHPWSMDGSRGLYEISIAMLRTSYSYRGWETCNMVMGEVVNPFRTVGIAGPLAIATLTLLYTGCVYAYYLVVPKSELEGSGTVIAGVFLLKLFGESASARLLPLCICLSNLGNILVVTFAASRVSQAVGKSRILPFSDYLASDWPWGTPSAGLAIHFFMTCVTTLLPPPGEVYNFVIDTSTYPVNCFATAVTVGLIYLHANREAENWGQNPQGWHTPLVLILLFLAANLVMIVFPWIPPPEWHNQLPYYASPLASLLVLLLGIVYWYYRPDRPIELDDSNVSREPLSVSEALAETDV